MPRLPLNRLEEALGDPIGYRRKMETTADEYFPPSYFNALRDAIAKYHRTAEGSSEAIAYLQERLTKFKNQERCEDTVGRLLWYISEYENRGWPTSQTRLNVQVELPHWTPDALMCSGQISRVDVVPTGGYAAWLMRNSGAEGWEHELQMPLLQDTLASRVLCVPVDEVSVGIYSFEERFVGLRCFRVSEIQEAYADLERLLRRMGY